MDTNQYTIILLIGKSVTYGSGRFGQLALCDDSLIGSFSALLLSKMHPVKC